jgi:hypothetical protein
MQTPIHAMHYERHRPMKTNYTYAKIVLLLLGAVMFTVASARADTYSWTNFQSDIPGVAQHVDPNLVNPWGMAASSTSSNGVIWVSDNGTGVSTLYEDGSSSGWNPTLDQTHAIIAVDNGTNHGVNRAIYKGATLGVANGHNFLYVTDFHTGKVETYDENFHQVTPNGFVDPNLPAGYGPFGIRNFNGEIFVTYAKQDHKREDDVACDGCGFVNVFDTSGNFLRRLISNGELNAPWGLALVDGELWVGNFGNGLINNYDPNTGAFIETLMRADGTPLQFDGLWDLLPLGDGVYFTAGIADEGHGLFGLITED